MSHIPVLEAFDVLGSRPHAIAGTSIGAVFGAAYASGLTGTQIRQIAMDTFGDRNAVLSNLWKLRPKRISDLFQGNVVQFDPLKVLSVFVAEYLPKTFEDLEIPLRVLTTDFYGCSETDIDTGQLLPAIAASIAITAVFRPVKRGERVLIDGGAVNPLPFDRRPLDTDIVAAVDVVGSPVPRSGRQLPTSMDAIFGASQILMQSLTTEKLKRRHPDLLLRPEHDNVRVLDFLKTKQILDRAEPLRRQTIEALSELIDQNIR